MTHENFNEKMPTEKKLFELNEDDGIFLNEGWEQECAEARENNNWSRATFVAARMAEMGIRPDIGNEEWQGSLKVLEFKRSKADAWGIAYQARYLYEIDANRAQQEIKLSDSEKQVMVSELNRRKEEGLQDQGKWGDFLAMLDHVKKIAPDVFGQIALDKKVMDGIFEHLRFRQTGKDYRYLVHLANALENIAPGALKQGGFAGEQLSEAITKLAESAQQDKEKKDTWAYAFATSQIFGLQKVLKEGGIKNEKT